MYFRVFPIGGKFPQVWTCRLYLFLKLVVLIEWRFFDLVESFVFVHFCKNKKTFGGTVTGDLHKSMVIFEGNEMFDMFI